MLLVCRAEPALQFVARWACLGEKNWVTDFSVSVLKCSMLIDEVNVLAIKKISKFRNLLH